MNYRAWQVKQPDEKAAARLAGAIGAPLLLARILTARGICDPAGALAFLQEDAPLGDPFAPVSYTHLAPGCFDCRGGAGGQASGSNRQA